MASTVDLLAKVSLFHGIPAAALERLSRRLKPLVFAKEAAIVNQDDPGDAMFIIQRGRVKVVLFGASGREVILSLLRPGDFFGEMSLLDGQPRSANVVAIDKAQVLMLSRQDFVAHLNENPSTALNILAEMCLRLRRADEVIGNLALLDVYGRVARMLIDMAARDGENTDEGVMIRHRPTQQELAAMIGTSRETVSRVLSEFQRRGFLSLQGKAILLSHGFAEQQLGERS